MMLTRNDQREVQDAIELRMKIVQAGALRASVSQVPAPVQVPKSAPAKLFLVKGSAGVNRIAVRERVKRTGAGRVLVMPLRQTARENERVLNALAGLGPMMWLGHSVLRICGVL